MQNPQKENGFTPIANEILEQIVATPLPAGEIRLLLFFFRKTYGWGKKEDKISLTQFEKGLKLSRPTVSKYFKNLKARNILVVTPLLVIKFNKDWDSWVVDTPLLVKNKKNTSSYAPTESGSPAPTHKRKKEKTKETLVVTDREFNFKEEMRLLTEGGKNGNRKDYKIIALYWFKKGLKFENRAQFNTAIQREVKPANLLKGYSGEQIDRTIDFCQKKYDDWSLETIVKKINDVNR